MVQLVVVKVFVDVLAALHEGQMAGNVFAFDSNRPYGSSGQGGQRTNTVVKPGDLVVWSPLSLECEAFVDIVNVSVPGATSSRRLIHGTPFWTAEIPRDPIATNYRVVFELGHLGRLMELDTLELRTEQRVSR